MSQSDYISFKKRTLLLNNNSNPLPSVLTSDLYTAFTKYNLETTVQNTKKSYSGLDNTDNCPLPEFILCKDTDTRPNRMRNPIQNPTPIKKWKKTTDYKPKTCDYISGYVTRRCLCSKKVCKCKTEYYPEKMV